MHSDIKRGIAMLGSAERFEVDHPQIPENARATLLFSEVRAAVADLRSMGGSQETYRGRFLGGASVRRQVADEMRLLMRQIARVAKVLPVSEYAEAREKLRVPRSSGFHPLLTRADVYLRTLPPIKSAFLERGMPADFDTRLRTLMDRFEAATKTKNTGLFNQVGSTAAMKARLRDAVRAVRELDVILSLLLQNDPALYAAWRSASHIERAPRRRQKTNADGGHTIAVSDERNPVVANPPPPAVDPLQGLLWAEESSPPPDT